MLPKAFVSHALQNRTRLLIPTKRKSKDYFLNLQKELSRCDGIENVDPNLLTGSVLIRHNVELDKIKEYGEAKHIFSLIKEEPPSRIEPRRVMSLGIFGLAAYQAYRGILLPPAWPLFRDALEFYKGVPLPDDED
jgi:hypothetical protein